MKRQHLFTLIGIAALLIFGALYWSFFRTPEAASGTIDTAIVAVEESGAGAVYVIDSAESTATFTIDEVLRGDDFTVVGTTDQVGGQIVFDIANPTAAQIGEIVINTRTFATDSDMRDRAIQNRILTTEQYEFVRFQPTAINGLPTSVTVGDVVELEIVGDLTIKDVTQQETFLATVTVVSADQLVGTATTTITYADYGVNVPLTQSVSAVADELTLALDFTAFTQ